MTEIKIEQVALNGNEAKDQADDNQKDNNYEEVSLPKHRETNYSQSNDFLNRIEEATLQVKEKDTFANASPLGYFSYGMDLFVYALAVAGVCEIDSLVIGDCLCIGGIAQITAGIFSFIQGKTVEASIFLLYSILGIMICTNQVFTNCTWAPAISPNEYLAFYSFWSFLSLGLLMITFKKHLILTLMVFFMLLMQILRCFAYGLDSNNCSIASGVCGVLSCVCSMYLGYAELINEHYDKKIFPVFAYEDMRNEPNKI